MTQIILGVGVLLAMALAVRWFANAQPGQVMRALKWIAIGTAAMGVLFIVLTGRWGLIPFLVFAVLPWLRQLRQFWRAGRTMRGPTPGAASEVKTRYLRLSLDHDTGALDGEVILGTYAGRPLGTMGEGELRMLLAEISGDSDSMRLLEAYLDRVHPAWRDSGMGREDREEPPSSAAMTREEAHRVLGVAPGASAEAIKDAHRRLMAKLHPDRGGSDYLAAKINQAKDILLGS